MKINKYLIENAMQAGRWTVPLLAKELGIHRQSLYNWIGNEDIPKAEYIFKISKILNIPVNEIAIEESL
jgi:transcriptional regulator with XRE-family HTH domain